MNPAQKAVQTRRQKPIFSRAIEAKLKWYYAVIDWNAAGELLSNHYYRIHQLATYAVINRDKLNVVSTLI